MALVLFVAIAPALADDNAKDNNAKDDKVAKQVTYVGKVVEISSTKLVMTGKEGKEHFHALTAAAKITCDGKVCKSSDLKPGMKIRVTSESETPNTATQVEAIDKNLKFASL